jgi:hypothetical protein
MAESLRLSGEFSNSSEAAPRISRGVASPDSNPNGAGKAEPFRTVLRQSRKIKSNDDIMMTPSLHD